jgi:hypothetical protein
VPACLQDACGGDEERVSRSWVRAPRAACKEAKRPFANAISFQLFVLADR